MAQQQGPSRRDLLYARGYIARMVGPMEAARYFTRLLQFDERHLQLMVSILRGAFFIIHPAVHHVQPSPIQVIANQPAWLLDYKSRGYGTVVPQRLYRDAQSHPNVPLNMPIFFAHSELGTLGLRLAQAREGNIEGLLDGRAPALVGDCNTTYIRIQWPGYNEWTSQITTRETSPTQNTITLETLAECVADAVRRFLEIGAGQQCGLPAWQVGGPGGITADDIIIVGLIHVTQGSWQPILQLERHIS
ncbi:hypothetical protein DFH94DRAFT_16357 [Russula ochroleuca]|uniref:Uncharacterized protein n=1 Tax=Russula ochroleuca TaxID=152965 RepID=A0A9P5N642_9AGAM|nr:hypothetical protein DFH94DRAFT_16357 [Russula ochroleuca]